MRRSGFTLIEILVVGVIVAIVAGILMSAFLAVRRAAWQSTCKANLGQLGKAVHLYLGEHDDLFPPYGSPGADGGFATKEGQLKEAYLRYGTTHAQFYCPLDERKGTTRPPGPDVVKSFSSHAHTSFLFNASELLFFIKPGELPFSANRIKDPAKHVVVLDQEELVQRAPGDLFYRSSHGSKYNTCFFDGHVRTRTYGKPTSP